MTIPTLTTERLILRGFRREDFAGVYALWSDPRTGRLMGMQPMSEEDCWAKFLRSFGAWQVNGFGFWGVEEKASGNFVGELGFLNAKRAIEPPLPVPEMGWSFSPSVQGRGYATEGVAAAIRWGEDHFGRARFSAIIAPENEPSLKLARKFGFAEVARTTYKDHPTIILYREP
jgi:RimJ/RimL family protein N-acetyltransferase